MYLLDAVEKGMRNIIVPTVQRDHDYNIIREIPINFAKMNLCIEIGEDKDYDE